MTAPLIGLTTYGRDAEDRFSLPANYLDAVRAAGGIPVLLAPGESHWKTILETVDGIVLTGGGDIAPDHYGSDGHADIYGVSEERDTLELEVTQWCLERRLPVFGICRGCQLLNVALGGTLLEHLPDVVGNDIEHRRLPRTPVHHPIQLSPGSQLAQICQERDFSAASLHHQAIDQVAPVLQVVAHAPDGTVEAIEMPGHPELIAVQWHPEMTAFEDPIQQRIFSAFIELCQDFHQESHGSHHPDTC